MLLKRAFTFIGLFQVSLFQVSLGSSPLDSITLERPNHARILIQEDEYLKNLSKKKVLRVSSVTAAIITSIAAGKLVTYLLSMPRSEVLSTSYSKLNRRERIKDLLISQFVLAFFIGTYEGFYQLSGKMWKNVKESFINLFTEKNKFNEPARQILLFIKSVNLGAEGFLDSESYDKEFFKKRARNAHSLLVRAIEKFIGIAAASAKVKGDLDLEKWLLNSNLSAGQPVPGKPGSDQSGADQSGAANLLFLATEELTVSLELLLSGKEDIDLDVKYKKFLDSVKRVVYNCEIV